MLERRNSDPIDGESDGRQSSSDQGEQKTQPPDTKPDASKTEQVVITAKDVGSVDTVIEKPDARTAPPTALPEVSPVEPERLTVYGVLTT